MSSFAHLILFSFFCIKSSSSNYIFCTSQCPQLTVPFSEPTRLPTQCGESTNIHQAALVCAIDYRIDYDAGNVYLNFKASNDTSILRDENQTEFLTQTLWLGFTTESGQPNITNRQYGCTYKDDCARVYYLNTIKRLVTDGKRVLEKIHSKLYRPRLSRNNFSRYRCKDSARLGNHSSVLCKRGLCYAQNINTKQYCTDDNAPTLFSDMVYYFPRAITDEREYIEYKCNKNLCNRNATMELIRKYLQNYTDWYDMTHADEIRVETRSAGSHRSVSYCVLFVTFFTVRFFV